MFGIKSLVLATLASGVLSAPAKVDKRQSTANVPDYVLKYAPIVFLHSQEQYQPSDLQTHLNNVTPKINFSPLAGAPNPLTLSNLNQLPGGVYLTSNDDVTTNPAWLKGTKPDGNGKVNNAISTAVIVNDHGDGTVDAFYMYFYSYNWGGLVLDIPALNFGNHVGDWEHNMVRFSNGVPTYVWYSQHSNGQAFSYSILEKYTDGLRPVSYSANGSHANYAIAGTHDHTIPNLNLLGGPLEDHTEKATLYDPLQSAAFYKFDASSNTFSAYDGTSPTQWLDYTTAWGDQQYPNSDKRQVVVFGEAKFVSGPTGPRDKQLGRTNVCPDNGQQCILRGVLVPRSVELEDRIFEEDVVIA